MKMIAVNNDIHKSIKIISAQTGKTIMDLIVEAIHLLVEKYKNDNN